MNWYVLYVQSRKEKKVAEMLQEMKVQVYCPHIKEIRQWSDRKKTIESPLFKSYVFVRLQDRERQLVFGVPGVVRYLFWLGKPAVVRDEEIQAIKKDQATYQDFITKLQGNDKAEALYSLVMLTVDKMKDVIGVNAATVLALDVIKSCL